MELCLTAHVPSSPSGRDGVIHCNNGRSQLLQTISHTDFGSEWVASPRTGSMNVPNCASDSQIRVDQSTRLYLVHLNWRPNVPSLARELSTLTGSMRARPANPHVACSKSSDAALSKHTTCSSVSPTACRERKRYFVVLVCYTINASASILPSPSHPSHLSSCCRCAMSSERHARIDSHYGHSNLSHIDPYYSDRISGCKDC